MHGCMCTFAESVACIQRGVFDHHACVGVYIKQVFGHQHTHLRTRSLQGEHMRSCLCSLFIQRWGTRVGDSASL